MESRRSREMSLLSRVVREVAMASGTISVAGVLSDPLRALHLVLLVKELIARWQGPVYARMQVQR